VRWTLWRRWEEGGSRGLVNNHCLNRPDEALLRRLAAAPVVAVCEGQNVATGLGSRLGSWLLARGLSVPLHLFGTHRGGNCGMGEQMHHQGSLRDGIPSLAPRDPLRLRKKVETADKPDIGVPTHMRKQLALLLQLAPSPSPLQPMEMGALAERAGHLVPHNTAWTIIPAVTPSSLPTGRPWPLR
jgi:hypothetical protein